jgi:Yip1 domain
VNLVDRVKNILLAPKDEWPKIAPEAETTQSMYTGYIMILAAIGPIAILLRSFAIGFAVVPALIGYLVSLAITFLLALIVDALAPTFGGEKNFIQSLKLTAYSYTAAWIAGIFQLLGFLGGIIGLIASIYAFYTFYLGVPIMKKCPPEKAAAYTIVVVICGIVLGVVLAGALMSMVVGGGMGLAGMGR